MPPRPLRPPVLGRLLLRLARLGARRAESQADLDELFARRVEKHGHAAARRRYLADALSLMWRRSPAIASSPRVADPSPPFWRIDPMLNDIRFALRLFRRQAGVMTLAVAGLALAIGVNTTAFSFVNAMALRPLGVADPEGVVQVHRAVGPSGARFDWAYGDYLQLRERARLLTAEASVATSVRMDGSASSVRVRFVSGGFFETFGAKLAFGRGVRPPDDTPGAPPVLVLSHAYWKSGFGGDPQVVGSVVSIAGTPVTIVGISAREFTGPFSEPPAAWLPLGSAQAIYFHLGPYVPASQAPVTVTAQVKAGEARTRVEAEASAVQAGITAAAPAAEANRPTGVRLEGGAGRFGRGSDLVAIASLLMGLVGLVLLLACTNIANLLLAGATTRRQEIAARLALGASRGRIVRQLLTESVILSLAAGVLGLLVAIWLLPAVAALVNLPAGLDVSPDLRVFGFAFAASLIAGMAAGLAPARHGSRGDVLTPLKGAGGSMGAPAQSGRLRSTFVGIQAAASVLLLVLAALFGRVLLYVSTTDVGFNPAMFMSARPGLRTVQVGLSPGTFTRDDGARSGAFLTSALARARTLPGVAAAGVALYGPFESVIMPVLASHNGRTSTVHENRTSADYFDTIGLGLVRGRLFTDDEGRQQAPVAVISASLARTLWNTDDPIGSIVDDSGRRPIAGLPDLSTVRIVGVVDDAVQNWRHPDVGMVYLPLRPEDTRGVAQLILRTVGDASTHARPIQEAIGALATDQPITWTLAVDRLDRQLAPARIAAALAGMLGLLALALAVVGIFGVTAFVVNQRLTEVGIRMALGATRRDVFALLFAGGLRPVTIGLGIGVVVSLGAGQVFSAVLYGVSPRDPFAIAAAVVVLLAAAGTAVFIPARRAARVDPALVLRQS